MKVLVLNGSPKDEKSNTMRLTGAFLEGANWTNTEVIHIAKENIMGCRGCFSCWNRTPGECVIKDGMDKAHAKIINADVIIWSFPLYYFSVPGVLKNFIDRMLPLSLPFMAKDTKSGGHPSRYDSSNQRHVIISTCGFWTAKGNYDAVISMFDHIFGKDNYTAIFCGQGELFRVPELKSRTDEYLKIVKRSGAEYASGGIHDKTCQELSEPLYPREVFERMADASWGICENENPNGEIDDSFSFTKQMAALYRPDGVERVLEFYYTDIDKTYQILMMKEGAKVIKDEFVPYTTRIETPYSLWRSISRGDISGEVALFKHLYKVLGDFSLMLEWDKLFGATSGQKQDSSKLRKKANMMILLMPWIIIWIALAIDPIIGGVLGIASIAIVPLLWLVFRTVIFELISFPLIVGFSLAALFGLDIKIIVSGSYLAFGLIWFISTFSKIPLTAYYSATKYGDEGAFKNPLFVRTNRILTAAWGILYLLIPIWTYSFMGTDYSVYIGFINSAITIIMGIFTLWFQKWYPAWHARGGRR